MKAAIFHGPQQPLTIEDVDIDKPIGREVLVRTVASGVCHSDLHFVEGSARSRRRPSSATRRPASSRRSGPHVNEFKPGDHVIACLSVFCGHCELLPTGRTHLCQTPARARAPAEPPRLSWKGEPVNQFVNLSTLRRADARARERS